MRVFLFMQTETKLFVAVIIQSLMDSLNKFIDIESKNSYHHITAKEWLGTDDFRYICELASLHPKTVLKIYKKFNHYKDYLTPETTKILLHEAFSRHKQLSM